MDGQGGALEGSGKSGERHGSGGAVRRIGLERHEGQGIRRGYESRGERHRYRSAQQ